MVDTFPSDEDAIHLVEVETSPPLVGDSSDGTSTARDEDVMADAPEIVALDTETDTSSAVDEEAEADVPSVDQDAETHTAPTVDEDVEADACEIGDQATGAGALRRVDQEISADTVSADQDTSAFVAPTFSKEPWVLAATFAVAHQDDGSLSSGASVLSPSMPSAPNSAVYTAKAVPAIAPRRLWRARGHTPMCKMQLLVRRALAR